MQPKTIVIVDDEPDMASYLRTVLADSGYRVFVAANGKEGIEMILNLQPDLVFLDVLMPVVQGPEALQFLKGQPGLESTKFVLISSLPPGEFDIMSSRRGWADGYLLKPTSTRLVLQTVGNLLTEVP